MVIAVVVNLAKVVIVEKLMRMANIQKRATRCKNVALEILMIFTAHPIRPASVLSAVLRILARGEFGFLARNTSARMGRD
jgi:hypothetical protein